METLTLVTARGGSKGVPGKNVRRINGWSPLEFIAAAVHASRSVSEAVVSTDDVEIAAAATAAGLEVPFLRPASLASDEATSIDVILHALEFLDPGRSRYDSVMLLQPTCPYRPPSLLDHCMVTYRESDAGSLLTVVAIPDHHHPLWALRGLDDGAPVMRVEPFDQKPPPRRQILPKAFARHGGVYITARDVLDAGFIVSAPAIAVEVVGERYCINIDVPADLDRAVSLLPKRFLETVTWLRHQGPSLP